MPTIKTKKEMNLPELIEWAIKKDIKDEKFYSKNGCHISIDFRGHVFLWDIRLNEIFIVEVEEEITEDTVIPKMLEKSFDAYQNVVLDIQVNQSINTVKENAEVLTLHVINDDDTHTLIWRDGKLVE